MPSPPPPEPDMPRPWTTLVLGGARSGKSAHAQALAERSGHAPVYCATATVWDREMEERVAAHRATRDERWRTIEAPIDLAGTLGLEAGPGRVVVVDCLTLWLTNLMLGDHDIEEATTRLLDVVRNPNGPLLFVSNEVGSGIVPDNPLGRRFRDAQGRLNQAMAQACDAAILVVAGLPLVLKGPVPDTARG